MEQHPLLKGFPVTLAINVAWGEMDAFQHVNNVMFFRYFESVRMRHFVLCGFQTHFEEHHVGPILAETAVKFIKPLTFPDTAWVGAKITEMSHDRFRQEYALVSERENRLCAIGSAVVVAYDYNQLQKTALPETVVAQMRALEGFRDGPNHP